jgi:hypothetical protein
MGIVSNTNQPSITVTSPNGGENWKVGETHKIIWVSQGGVTSSYALSLSCGTSVFQIGAASSGSLSYSWTIPTNLFSTSYQNCKVQISSGSTLGYSNLINLYVPSTPSITVTSPNGGENWKVGETKTITWTSSNLPSGALVSIGINGDGQTSTMAGGQIITNVPASNGVYAWTLPSFLGENLAGKKYGVYVTCTNCGSAVGDVSNNYFTISAASTTPSCTGYLSNYVVLNSMTSSAGTVSFKLTNTKSTAQTVLVSIGSGAVNTSSIAVPAGTCESTKSITYSTTSNTTITFKLSSGEIIASLPVSATDSSTSYCCEFKTRFEASYGKRCGDAGYDSVADLDDDGEIGLGDLSYYAGNDANESWCQEKLNKTTSTCLTAYNNNNAIASISSALAALMAQVQALLGR